MKNFRKLGILCSNWYGTSNLFSFFVCLFLNYDGIVRILARDNTDTFSILDVLDLRDFLIGENSFLS